MKSFFIHVHITYVCIQGVLSILISNGFSYSYNGFYNPPLVTGREYKIWYGAGNVVDGVERFEYIPIEQPVVGK